MQFCGVRLPQPQRMLKLYYAEEEIRCRLTWRMSEKRSWEMAFAEQALEKHVASMEVVCSRIESTVLAF